MQFLFYTDLKHCANINIYLDNRQLQVYNGQKIKGGNARRLMNRRKEVHVYYYTSPADRGCGKYRKNEHKLRAKYEF